MKKILVLFLLLFAVQAQAAGIYTTVARGTVTQANMKISAVDGTAFIDFSAANVLTTKLGHLLRIRDSSGRAIQGFIKAAGTGETLGDELITSWEFNNCDTFTTSGTDISAAIDTTVSAASFNFGDQQYKLLKWTLGSLTNSATAPKLILGSISNVLSTTADSYVSGDATPPSSKYFTSSSSSRVYGGYRVITGTTNYSASGNSLKVVTAPSTTGVTIVSTKGGSTFNFALKNSAFNYNDSSEYTYEIIQVRQLPVIATHSITEKTARIDVTEANAFAAPIGVDLSAYQDGQHMLALYDASGYAAIAHISATPPGGEAFGDELITNWTNSSLSYDTLTVNANGHDIDSLINLSDKIAGCYTNQNVVIGELYKIVIDVTVNSGTAPSIRTSRSTSGAVNQTIAAPISDGALYWTAGANPVNGNLDTGFSLYGVSAVNMSILISQKKMTTPPATGVLLLSRKGGDRGWLYKHASFNPNSAITAKILYVGD